MRLSIEYLLISLLFVATAHAQSSPIRNDTPTTLRDLGANLNVGANYAVDQYGQIRIGNITPGTAATSLGKARDAVAGASDVGIMALAQRNTGFAALVGTDGDYSPLGVNTYGGVYCDLNNAQQNENSPVRAEDAAFGDTNGVMVAGAVREDALTSSTSTTGDVINLKADALGRLVTTFAPPGQSQQGCGTATASTADVAIRAAVASNRHYITSITCASSDADNATNINFKDGSTVIAVGGVNQMATTSAGTFTATFNPPLRGTVNTAFNFNTAVATSSVICCAAGYISVL